MNNDNLDQSNSLEQRNPEKKSEKVNILKPINQATFDDEEEKPPSIETFSNKIKNKMLKSESVSKNLNLFIDSAKINLKYPILEKEILLNENDKIIKNKVNELMSRMIKNSNEIISVYHKFNSLESYQKHVKKTLEDQYKKFNKQKFDTIEKLSIMQPNGVQMHRINYFLRDEITDITRGFEKRKKIIINDKYKKKLEELECKDSEEDEEEVELKTKN